MTVNFRLYRTLWVNDAYQVDRRLAIPASFFSCQWDFAAARSEWKLFFELQCQVARFLPVISKKGLLKHLLKVARQHSSEFTFRKLQTVAFHSQVFPLMFPDEANFSMEISVKRRRRHEKGSRVVNFRWKFAHVGFSALSHSRPPRSECFYRKPAPNWAVMQLFWISTLFSRIGKQMRFFSVYNRMSGFPRADFTLTAEGWSWKALRNSRVESTRSKLMKYLAFSCGELVKRNSQIHLRSKQTETQLSSNYSLNRKTNITTHCLQPQMQCSVIMFDDYQDNKVVMTPDKLGRRTLIWSSWISLDCVDW